MQTELLIVVDEHDHPVGTASRSDVHTKGLFHRAVHILVINNCKPSIPPTPKHFQGPLSQQMG